MTIPDPPTDREIFESPIAQYWFDDEGFLVSLSKNPRRTVENLTENVAVVKRITNNTPVPLLIYLSNSPVPDKKAREFSTQALPQIYTAMAMVSEGGLGKFIMNILFRVKPPAIPMKSFSDEESAKQWLQQYI